MTEFEHNKRLERALRLAASSIPIKPLSHFKQQKQQQPKKQTNYFTTTTFRKPARKHWAKTAPPIQPASVPSATSATFATYSEGGGARRLALKTAPLLAEEREHNSESLPTRLITPFLRDSQQKHYAPPKTFSTSQSRSRSRSRNPSATRTKSVLLIDPKEQISVSLLEKHLSDFYQYHGDVDENGRLVSREERRRKDADSSDVDNYPDSRMGVPYSVYPSWWGHEEHVPSHGHQTRRSKKNRNKRNTGNDGIKSVDEGVQTVDGSAAGFSRRGRTLMRDMYGNSARKKTVVDKATETDHEDEEGEIRIKKVGHVDVPIKMNRYVTESEDEEEEGGETDTEAEQEISMERGRLGNNHGWLRKEEPTISKWKFPKHCVDESVQVNLDSTSKSTFTVPKHRRNQRNRSPSAATSVSFSSSSVSQSPSPLKRSSENPTTTTITQTTRKPKDNTRKQHTSPSPPPSPRRQVPTESNRFHHFTIPVHDLVPSKKAKNKNTIAKGTDNKPNTPATATTVKNKSPKPKHSAASSTSIGGMVGLASREQQKKRDKSSEGQPVTQQKSVLDIVYAFLGDERVMAALDLNVLKEDDGE
ncbi:UNVERIFIED_CONTAM: hypothetical protein HDU68_011946 [Siphonaria sp. JEL0065]|nr:hypothetical protein HDU68_011946 [Siphonaria sp. JEL0065]